MASAIWSQPRVPLAPALAGNMHSATRPKAVPPVDPLLSTQQWYGLSGTNDGTGRLQNGTRQAYASLTWSHQTFGVDLDWTDASSLWKVQALSGSTANVRGKPLHCAFGAEGGSNTGIKIGGVDLQLSDTPAYEWYVLGATPGWQIDSGEFALWNSAAHDYLVLSSQTWGVDLNGYQKTMPRKLPPATATGGPQLCHRLQLHHGSAPFLQDAGR